MSTRTTVTLSEYESKGLLAVYGIPVLEERLVRTPREAVDAAGEIGEPVVLKLCGRSITHKTERGLVQLGLRGIAAIHDAAEALLAAARPEDGAVDLLVAPMVHGGRELIAGLHRDRQFGPCVMIGVGGTLAEAVRDVAFRLVPLEPIDAQEMVEDLRTQQLLGAFRGDPPIDRAGLHDVLLGLSRFGQEHPEVVSADVNPLIVVGDRPVAVDALVETEAAE